MYYCTVHTYFSFGELKKFKIQSLAMVILQSLWCSAMRDQAGSWHVENLNVIYLYICINEHTRA